MRSRPLVLVDLLSYTGTKGGMETYTRELYGELSRRETGLDFVGLASAEGGAMDLSWFPGELVRSRISGENRVVWAYGELVASSWHAHRRRVDLVHCPATLGPMWTSMPTVITIHDMLYWSHPEFMETPLYTKPVKWMERRGAGNATRLITDSQVSADEIHRFLGFPTDRLHVVPLGPSRAAARSEVPIAERENLVVASGARRPYKNWDGLIRALALVDPAERPRLVVTGGRAGDPLPAVVDAAGLHDWVEVRGWVADDELDDLYRRARAMAMPTFAEGFGLPVIEAMAAGLPVIASDIPVLREVAGDSAVWFDPHDAESMADALRMVSTRPDVLQNHARTGLPRAREFTWARTADETLEVLRAALDDDVGAEVGGDLLERQPARLLAPGGADVPLQRASHRFLPAPDAVPAQRQGGEGGVQREVLRLDHGRLRHDRRSAGCHPGQALPLGGSEGHEVLHGDCLGGGRPEVEGRRHRAPLGEVLGVEEIAEQRLDHVLPRAHRRRAAQRQHLTGRPGAHEVGNDPVAREVATTDDIARTRGGDGSGRGRPRVHDELGGRLAGGVGVLAAQEVVLPVRRGLADVVDLVGRDHDRGQQRVERGGQRHHPNGAQHVGLERDVGHAVALADEALGREVEDHLGSEGACVVQPLPPGHVGPALGESGGAFERQRLPQAALPVLARQRHAVDDGAEALQPADQPGALEPGVAGHEDPSAGPERRIVRALHRGHPRTCDRCWSVAD